MRDRLPCTYMLASQIRGTLYTGVTSDLLARVIQHREAMIAGFTKRHGVKRLVWYEVADTMGAAITREKRIKDWHRAWKIRLIEETNRYWDDLAVGLFGLDPLPPYMPRRGSRPSPG